MGSVAREYPEPPDHSPSGRTPSWQLWPPPPPSVGGRRLGVPESILKASSGSFPSSSRCLSLPREDPQHRAAVTLCPTVAYAIRPQWCGETWGTPVPGSLSLEVGVAKRKHATPARRLLPESSLDPQVEVPNPTLATPRSENETAPAVIGRGGETVRVVLPGAAPASLSLRPGAAVASTTCRSSLLLGTQQIRHLSGAIVSCILHPRPDFLRSQ